MVCGKCKMNNTNAVCYCNSCFQNARLNARQEGRVEGAIEQKEKDKIIFVHVEKVKNKERVRIVFADETIQFFDL